MRRALIPLGQMVTTRTRAKKPRASKPSTPPKPSKGKDLEHKHQATFISIVRRMNSVAGRKTYSCPNGFLRSKSMRIRAWQEGVVAGVWDVHVPIPMWDKGYCGLYIEFKAGTNTLSPEQKDFQRELEPLGFRFEVVYSWQEAIKAFCDYLDLEVQST